MGTSTGWDPSGLARRRLSGDRGAALRLLAIVVLMIVSPFLPSPSQVSGTRSVPEARARPPGPIGERACGRGAPAPARVGVRTRCD